MLLKEIMKWFLGVAFFFVVLSNALWSDQTVQSIKDYMIPSQELQEHFGDNSGTQSLDDLFPGMEDHIQNVINQLSYLRVIQNEKSLRVEGRLKPRSLWLQIKETKEAEEGALYAVDLSRNISFEVAIRLEELRVENISGVKFLVNIPWFPDGVYPQSFEMNAKDQILKTHFEALWGLFDIVGEVDVREHKVIGIKYGESLKENIKSVLRLFFCGIFCAAKL